MLYNFFPENDEYNECTAKGACSLPPSVTALQEVILISLRQLAYYVLSLESLGENCGSERELIINTLATIVSTTDYSDEQHLKAVSEIYSHLLASRDKYINLCNKHGITCKELKSPFCIKPQMTLSKIISLGEKAFLNKYKKVSLPQKNMTEIMLAVLKSAALNVSKLISYNVDTHFAVSEILNGLNLLNSRLSVLKIKKQIKVLAHIDMQLTENLYNIQQQHFGGTALTDVSFSTRKGKAILVSGECLLDLEKVLETVKEREIDVYTHDELIIAHSFNKFKNYKNLQGHYGTCNENCVLDFATFPGAILLTRNSNINIEYLYRGRLFTTAKMLPQGVIGVKDDDYNEVIASAQRAKGFAKGQKRASAIVGYDQNTLKEQFANLAERVKSGDITKIFVFGLGNSSQNSKAYFNDIVSVLPQDAFVISFSYDLKRDNFLHINVANNRPLVFWILKTLFEIIPEKPELFVFFLARCEISSISAMINLKEAGIGKIYLFHCPPNSINPAVLSTLESVYDIKLPNDIKSEVKNIVMQ